MSIFIYFSTGRNAFKIRIRQSKEELSFHLLVLNIKEILLAETSVASHRLIGRQSVVTPLTRYFYFLK